VSRIDLRGYASPRSTKVSGSTRRWGSERNAVEGVREDAVEATRCPQHPEEISNLDRARIAAR
jgi:hypothetical protein